MFMARLRGVELQLAGRTSFITGMDIPMRAGMAHAAVAGRDLIPAGPEPRVWPRC